MTDFGFNFGFFIFFIFMALIFWLAPVIACVWLAGNKGKDKVLWGIIGFLTGVIGLIILAILPEEGPKNKVTADTVATLKGLEELRANGTLTEDEFQAQKKKILADDQ